MALGVQMQQRRATEAVWTTSDYVLAAGELGVATDTGIIKIGNGVSTWTDLDPAFDSQYLPVLGKAADSELLDGINSTGFWQTADATTAATGNKLLKRMSDGRAKVANATESDDATTLYQQNALVAYTNGQLATTNANVATNTANISTNTGDIANLKMGSVADRAALLALSTVGKPYGYMVRQVDKNYLWMWDLTAWRFKGVPNGDQPWIRLSRATMSWGNTSGLVWGYGLSENQDTNFFSWTAGTSISAGGSITVTEAGRYRIMSWTPTDLNVGYWVLARHQCPGISTSTQLGKFASQQTDGVVNGFNDIMIYDEGWLAAGQVIQHYVSINQASSTLRSAQMMVTRLSS